MLHPHKAWEKTSPDGGLSSRSAWHNVLSPLNNNIVLDLNHLLVLSSHGLLVDGYSKPNKRGFLHHVLNGMVSQKVVNVAFGLSSTDISHHMFQLLLFPASVHHDLFLFCLLCVKVIF